MKSLSIEATLITTALIFISSCAPPQPTKIVPAEFKTGQNYYHRVCATCHGADALGKQTRAPGLIDPEYLSENFSDEEMYKQIIEGSDKMPPQRNKLSDPEVAEIIKYLRYSQKAAGILVEEDEPDDGDEE
jgi:mono/diheme cytochrome c family protein